MKIYRWIKRETATESDFKRWVLILLHLDVVYVSCRNVVTTHKRALTEEIWKEMETHKTGTILVLIGCIIITVTVAQLSHKSGHCPLKNSVTKCIPKCVSDFQCTFNEKCCPNKCGSQSCVAASAVSTGSGYKGSSNDAVYCAGVKCGPYEKCKLDRGTKREKCVRT